MQKFVLQRLTDYSDEAILEEIRRVAQIMGNVRLTREKFDELARVNSTTISRRFGSWLTAMDRAGVSAVQVPRPQKVSKQSVVLAIREFVHDNPYVQPTSVLIESYMKLPKGYINKHIGTVSECLIEAEVRQSPFARRYDDTECFENIMELWTYYGRQPTFGELKRAPSRVGPKAYVRRWGGWRAALSAFVEYVANPDQPNLPNISATLPKVEVICSSTNVSNPRSISLSMRYKVLIRDRFTCRICGQSPVTHHGVTLHIDHIHPLSKGGSNMPDNLRVLCFACNMGKGDKLEA